MSSLLVKTSLPLWVWIVIIVVGSLVVLGTVVFSVRCVIVRRRQAGFVDTFGDENLPQRKVTVRRGRVVEQSKYLSLTGSKFGLNAFVPDDADSRAGARSKSPFEWWSSVKDRSQSRNTQLTSMSMTYDGSSTHGMPSSPDQQRFYQRGEVNYSSTSLASTSKETEVSISVAEEQPSPAPVVKNFSRSFSRQGHYSGFPPRQRALSRIEESSPHTSMISARQSYASNKPDMKASTPSPLPYAPSLTDNFFRPPPLLHQEQPRSKASSIYHEAQPNFSQHSLQAPLPTAFNGSRTSVTDGEHRLSEVSSHSSTAPSKESTHRQSHVTALPKPPSETEANNYWETNNHPRRSSSLKKGKLLRKKSLKKAELVTQVDS